MLCDDLFNVVIEWCKCTDCITDVVHDHPYKTIRTLHKSLDFLNGVNVKHLKVIVANNVLHCLEPLHGLPIKKIEMYYFDGSLEPLHGAPIKDIWMSSFNGSLEPLRGAPIKEISMFHFTGSLEPLRGALLNYIHMPKLDKDLVDSYINY